MCSGKVWGMAEVRRVRSLELSSYRRSGLTIFERKGGGVVVQDLSEVEIADWCV